MTMLFLFAKGMQLKLAFKCVYLPIRVMLTPQEVKESLESQGAENVLIIPLKEHIETISNFVIATGKSHRQIRKMTESIVMAVRIVSFKVYLLKYKWAVERSKFTQGSWLERCGG